MKIIGLKDLRQNLNTYAKEVERGGSFVVVKRSKPLFKISSVSEDEGWEEAIDFTKIKKGGVNIKELLARM